MDRETAREDLTEMDRETVREDLTETVREAVREEPEEASPASHPLTLRYRPSRPATVRIRMPIRTTALIRETEWKTERQNPA